MNPAWENTNSAGAQGENATNGAVGAQELQQLPELSELDATLRFIASVPVPEGLEERVHATLRAAPRGARLLAWPTALRPQAAWLGSGWARTAAAAAIVFVVAGGGWGVYLRLPHSPKVVTMPATPKAGFSSAGAIHTPDSIQGPVITNPAIVNPVVANPVTANPVTANPVTAHPSAARPSAHHKTHPGKLKTNKAETANQAAPAPVSTMAPAAAPAH